MFRKTTISIMIAAITAIILSAQAPASAEEPFVEDHCFPLCGVARSVHDLGSVLIPAPPFGGTEDPPGAGLVFGLPGVGDGTPDVTVTLPDGVLNSLVDPLTGLADPGPALPPLTLEEPPAPTDPTDPVEPEPAPVDPPHAVHTDETGSANSEEPADEDRALEPTTTTASPVIQDDDVDEVAVAAIDLTTDGDTGEAFDPAMAALFGALGALGFFTVRTAAFVIGRRGG